MGYRMYSHGDDFRIDQQLKERALEALKDWDARLPYDSWGLGGCHELEDALGILGWACEPDESGNIVDIWFEGEKLHDENGWLSAIAPFVAAGSYIEMVGEDDEFWRWYFDGKTCVSYAGEVIFPGMPTQQEAS